MHPLTAMAKASLVVCGAAHHEAGITMFAAGWWGRTHLPAADTATQKSLAHDNREYFSADWLIPVFDTSMDRSLQITHYKESTL